MSEVKTPYALRLEMLQMAKEMLEQNFHMQRDIAMRYWDGMIENAQKMNSAVPSKDEVMNLMPKFPTVEEIMVQAEKMNAFVSGLTGAKTPIKK